MEINKQAMGILTLDEKSSLVLTKVQDKSSWQAGEILGRSHYKYLEIKQRAEKFFEMFTYHYDTYEQLIPEDVKLSQDFQDYLHYAIEKRQAIKNVITQIENPEYKKVKTRDIVIEKEVLYLKNTKSLHGRNLYNLIMDFDRYNNFRILPKSVQEPSAFKRRNKTRFRKHLNISTTLNPYTLFRIRELFEKTTKNLKKENEGFVVLACYPASKEIIRINANDDNLQALSRISLYVFKRKEQAIEYLDLIFDYLEERNPKKGLKFWPNFRNTVKTALNYGIINNIAPSRKSLYSALKDMDIYHKVKKDKEKVREHFSN